MSEERVKILGDTKRYLAIDGPSEFRIFMGLLEPRPCGRRRGVQLLLREAPTDVDHRREDWKLLGTGGPYAFEGSIVQVRTSLNTRRISFVVRNSERSPHRNFLVVRDYDPKTRTASWCKYYDKMPARTWSKPPRSHVGIVGNYSRLELLSRLTETEGGPGYKMLTLNLDTGGLAVNLQAHDGETYLIEGEKFQVMLDCMQRLDSEGHIFAFEALDSYGYAFHGEINLNRMSESWIAFGFGWDHDLK